MSRDPGKTGRQGPPPPNETGADAGTMTASFEEGRPHGFSAVGPEGVAPRPQDAATVSSPGAPCRPEEMPTVDAPERRTADDCANLDLVAEHPGRYRFGDGGGGGAEIGRGGIGRVLMAFDRHIGRDVAVKELLPGSAQPAGTGPEDERSRTSRIRFLREARVTGQLEHPSIVPVYELGRRPDGTLYYTMKLVRGRTLAAELSARRQLSERLRLMSHYLDLCQAVAYAHSRGVVHRDIKPANVMVGEFGETVVLDWGLARLRGADDLREKDLRRAVRMMEGGTELTLMGTTLGTPAYMSPEQAAGRVWEVDERSDVWSLGVVLFELLAGRLPLTGLPLPELLDRVRRGAVPTLGTASKDIPRELVFICERAMAVRPEDRYPSAREMVEDVQAWVSGRRLSGYEYTSWELVSRFVARNRAFSAAVALLLVALVAGAVVVTAAWRNEEASREGAELAWAAESQARARAEEERAAAMSARDLERRQRERAEASDRSARLATGMILAERAGESAAVSAWTEAEVLAAASLAVRSAAAAPEAELAESRGLFYRSRVGGPLVQTEHVFLQVSRQALAFSPSGDMLAAGDDLSRLTLFGLPGLRPVSSVELKAGKPYAVSWSADGHFVAVGTVDGWAELRDVEGRLRLSLPPGDAPVLAIGVAPGCERLAAFAQDGTVTVAPAGHACTQPGDDLDRLGAPGSPGPGDIRSARLDGAGPAAAFTSGVEALLVAQGSSVVRIDLAGLRETARSRDWGTPVTAVSCASAGMVCAVGLGDGTVRLVRAADLVEDRFLNAHTGEVLRMAFSRDGGTLVTAGADNSVVLFQNETRRIGRERGFPGNVLSVAVEPAGRMVAVALDNAGLAVFDCLGGPFERVVARHDRDVYAVALSPDSRWLASAGLDRTVRVNEVQGGRRTVALGGHEALVWSLAFSPDSRVLASVSRDRSVRLWSMGSFAEAARSLPHVGGDLSAVAFSPDGAALAVGSFDGSVRLLEGKSLTELRLLVPPASGALVWSLAFSPDGQRLAVGGERTPVRILRVSGDAGEVVPDHPADIVSSVHFSPDGRRLAASGRGGAVRLFDAAGGALVATLKGHGGWVNQARFSPDGRWIAAGADDKVLDLWEADRAALVLRIPMSARINGVAFSSDGLSLAASSGTEVSLLPVSEGLWARPPLELFEDAMERSGGRKRAWGRGLVAAMDADGRSNRKVEEGSR